MSSGEEKKEALLTPFQEWLTEQIEKSGLSYREVAQRGGISQGRISQVIGGENPGERFCIGIARGLGLPPAVVLEKSGILPPQPRQVPEEEQALSLFRRLNKTLRDSILVTMRSLANVPIQFQDSDTPHTLKEHLAYRLVQDLDELSLEEQQEVFEFMEQIRLRRGRKGRMSDGSSLSSKMESDL